MTAKEAERLILKAGWYLVNQQGSHRHYKHPLHPGKVTIPFHRGDLATKTLNAILKQARLK